MFIELIALLATGFLLGVQHSLDADHVAAVSAIVSEHTSLKGAAWVGAAWGLGHTSTLLVVGAIVLILKLAIPAVLAKWFEILVGFMLIYLGLLLLKNIFVDKLHLHKHAHGDTEHIHLHSHKGGAHHRHLHKPFLVGAVHGLAGSAGVLLLVMASMDSVAHGLFLTLTFGLGSILGMIATGAVIGLPVLFTAKHQTLHRVFMVFISCAAIAIGLNVLQKNWGV